MHDPPSKGLDIPLHMEKAKKSMLQAGFTEEEINKYNRPADFTASAADRFPFPDPRVSGMKCKFDGVDNAFHHPLGGAQGESLKLKFHSELTDVSAVEAEETEKTVQPVLREVPDDWGDDEKWRAQFFAHWRLWPKFATEKDYRFGFLPADTRIPDHTIWNHMQMVSALAGCASVTETPLKPAFLKLQIGPVQDFIAQSRSTRDLWSGSYFLSWLMAVGLKRLSELTGPDSVVFPTLRNQPLFDLHWRRELWDQVQIGNKPVWNSFEHDRNEELTPNLPNVFLAIVPAEDASEIAKSVEQAIKEELREIAESCWEFCGAAGLYNNSKDFLGVNREDRFYDQIENFLSVSWQITPWPRTNDEVMEVVSQVPFSADSDASVLNRVREVLKVAQEQMPFEHRDARYYLNDSKTDLSNVGVSWALLVALNAWQLDASRQNRAFDAWSDGGWDTGTAQNKDSITGKEEAVAGGREWRGKCDDLIDRGGEHTTLARRFKHDDWLGAISLIKRVWDLAYLKDWGLLPLRMPNTHGLAKHDPYSNEDDEDRVERLDGERYFAVLALDGDQIGKWVSGENSPRFGAQLADYSVDGVPKGSLAYFKNENLEALIETKRPVSPGYHLQLSEALSNYSLNCAGPIVEAFDGRLIYSGGDDVLAVLPADVAMPCANALRMAFRGDLNLADYLKSHAAECKRQNEEQGRRIEYHQALAAEGCLLGAHVTDAGSVPGFLCRLDKQQKHADGASRPIPFLVPGPAADCSVGITVAHFKSPLQDVVRSAAKAEQRAKAALGRSAVALTLLKHSGETIEWGCPWESGGLNLYEALASALKRGALTSRFPYRVVELLEPYFTNSTPLVQERGGRAKVTDFDVSAIIDREIRFALDQHCSDESRRETLTNAFSAFVKHMKRLHTRLNEQGGVVIDDESNFQIEAVVGLCKSVAFVERGKSQSKDKTQKSDTQEAA